MIWLFFQVAKAGQASGIQPDADAAATASAARFGMPQSVDDLQVLSASAEGMLLELTVPEFEVETASAAGQPCQVLTVPGFTENADPGRPRLPQRGAMLGVPANAALQLEVVESEVVQLPGHYQLCPGEAPIASWEAGQDGPPDILGYQALRDESF